MPLGPAAIDHLALLSRLALSEDEKRLFAEQLERIVAAVEKIGELDLSAVEPFTSAVPIRNAFREDREAPSLPREAALAAAPEKTAEGFVVPRVLAEGA